MKIAHLVLTHANPEQLGRLIKRLKHADAHFFVHIDLKSGIEPFLAPGADPHVHFIKNRVKVYWGGYSIVQATLNGFREILDCGILFDYINLMSGQDYPVKSTEEIHAFFEDNPGRAFMHTLSVENEWQEAIPRITRYHLANVNFPGKYRAEQLINSVMPKRKFPMDMTPVGRSQWFTITPANAAFIIGYLEKHPSIRRFFMLSWAPDEMIFQTILHNSPFRTEMVNDNLRYVDWSAGGASPKVLTIDDADKLAKSGKLFARKFSPDKSAELLDYLDRLAGVMANK